MHNQNPRLTSLKLSLGKYEEIGGAGAGNYEDIVAYHNPKGELADYRDFDEDPHNRSYSQQES